MWKSMRSKDEIVPLFNEFLVKYIDCYDEFMRGFIEQNFYDMIGERKIYTELLQLYSELGIIPDSDNHYVSHLNKIKNNFNITGNILEVASGKIPVLANMIAREQLKLGNGTITVYEPSLIETKPKYSNMKLYREEFNSTIDISKFDLVVSIMPCDATEDVIESVFNNNKDFYIAFCGCNHSPYNIFCDYAYYSFVPSYIEHVKSAKRLCEEHNMGEFIIDKLDDKYEIEYPIIYNKKR